MIWGLWKFPVSDILQIPSILQFTKFPKYFGNLDNVHLRNSFPSAIRQFWGFGGWKMSNVMHFALCFSKSVRASRCGVVHIVCETTANAKENTRQIKTSTQFPTRGGLENWDVSKSCILHHVLPSDFVHFVVFWCTFSLKPRLVR